MHSLRHSVDESLIVDQFGKIRSLVRLFHKCAERIVDLRLIGRRVRPLRPLLEKLENVSIQLDVDSDFRFDLFGEGLGMSSRNPPRRP
jgi:hypothetical protein